MSKIVNHRPPAQDGVLYLPPRPLGRVWTAAVERHSPDRRIIAARQRWHQGLKGGEAA